MKPACVSILIACAFASGCSTAVNHLAGDPHGAHPIGIFSGVRMDSRLLVNSDSEPESSQWRVPAICYSLLDFPFSAVGDTLLLPLDLANAPDSDTKP